MSYQRCQAETTATDFQKWRRWKAKQWNKHDKLDYYLAQIAECVALLAGIKSPTHFLIPFKADETQRTVKPHKSRKHRKALKVKAAVSKAVWTGWAAAMAGKTRCPPKSKNS